MATLNELFQAWGELNDKVQDSFGQFDFSKIKEKGKTLKSFLSLDFQFFQISG